MYGTVEYQLARSTVVNSMDSNNMYPQEKMFMALLESSDAQIRDLRAEIHQLKTRKNLLDENTALKLELKLVKDTNKMLMDKIEKELKQ